MSAPLPHNCPPGGIGDPEYFFVNASGLCEKQSSFFEGGHVLSEGVGYAIVLGFGVIFAAFTAYLVYLEKRYIGTQQTSEWFNTAGRNVKTGLIASVIVSQWTWAATILQSSNVAWKDGISGPFWYASGATVQILLFGILAIEIKRKAPNAHTVCEVIRARWGTAAHIVFLCYCLMTNVIVTAMLLLGGAAVVHALTGLNVYLASFLIPIGVILYTLAGGLMATFLAAYTHSAIIHVVLVIFMYAVYTLSDKLGSPAVVYEKLTAVASASRDCSLTNKGQHCGPVDGNHGGSYLTMLSPNGVVFGIINLIGNFGTVFVDNGYWMSAIAARPSSTHKGYMVGGLVWFAVPFSLGTSLGLGAVALDLPLTEAEAAAGLVPAATAVALMGKTGAALLLIMLFMAVTSAGSSELIAVSSLITYDIYRTYINPEATGRQILNVSRVVILIFGTIMGGLAAILNMAGVSLGWVFVTMGVLISSAVVPISALLLWRRANALGAMLGAVLGMCAGIVTWLSVTAIEFGRVNLDTTGRNAPTLAGNLVSILLGGIIHIVCSLVWPDDFDWVATRSIQVVERNAPNLDLEEFSEKRLTESRQWIMRYGLSVSLLLFVVWPLLALPAGVFNQGYFTFWAVLSVVWGTLGSIVIILMPLIENRETIYLILEGLSSKEDILAVDLLPPDSGRRENAGGLEDTDVADAGSPLKEFESTNK